MAQLTQNEINNAYFQQDGATAHTARHSMELLKQVFGNRIISKGVYPPRSPDLSPPDYFLWGACKSVVYKNTPKSIDDLKAAIREYFASITQDTLLKVFENKLRRVALCQANKERHFQHLL